ncbi:MAG: hypothetical protein KGY60_00085 [Bacteroidales bacterium]|nr:hypothetical protein [Bacteroidales bacterium]
MGFIASIQNRIRSTEKKTTGKKNKKKVLKFKTDLQCGGCVSKVQPHLDAIGLIDSWEVRLDNADKLMKVRTNRDDTEEVIRLVQGALDKEGYSAERMN